MRMVAKAARLQIPPPAKGRAVCLSSAGFEVMPGGPMAAPQSRMDLEMEREQDWSPLSAF